MVSVCVCVCAKGKGSFFLITPKVTQGFDA